MKNMNLLSIKKEGLHEVYVTIDNKPYTYRIDGKYGVDLFLDHYHAGRYGKAISTLNKFNEKEA